MSTRKKKQSGSYADYSDEDDSFDANEFEPSESDSDSDYVFEGNSKKKSQKKGQKNQKNQFSRSRSYGSRQGVKSTVRKRNMSGAMSLNLAPKVFCDIPKDDLNHDPSGDSCRFVEFEKIGKNVLQTEKYLLPNEKGVLTFLPNFEAGNPNHLDYFGFSSKLQKTELRSIKPMTDDQLREQLEMATAELNSIPPTKQATTISIPGFPTYLTDSIAINGDVRELDWKKLGQIQKFDVILMDPPWQIAVANVTRGVNIAYEQLATPDIAAMPLQYVQDNGFLFMWVIASQLMNGIKMMRDWGYKVVQTINWVKVSRTGRYMPSHGYYFQHNKETLLVGMKGEMPEELNADAFKSLIVAPREVRQSQKPEEMYKIIEEMFPGMMYLEVFARSHNLREGWVSIGIELPT
ncbi:hypothetical protein M9Y10_043243 [Tritrichomonas musculus]|uniref:mRNA m(6)A methyltransferase n=1 Tax=Tritrichomonas musculus TaxID=1915356 RepID=A0ABR2JZ56_9EUKA